MGSAGENNQPMSGEPEAVPAEEHEQEPVISAVVAAEMAEVEDEEDNEDAVVLRRETVLRRRRRHAEMLASYYRNEYWALMEEVKIKHRDYYWEYGLSPFEDEIEEGDGESKNEINGVDGGGILSLVAGTGAVVGLGTEGGEQKFGIGFGGKEKIVGDRCKCAFPGCKSKAMPLTKYCHAHILSDTEQTLYKGCKHMNKNSNAISCQRPILRTAVPSLCPVHLQKTQKTISLALKKAGLNIPSTKAPPKFSPIVSEYVNQIQAKRRRLHTGSTKFVNKDDSEKFL